MVLCPETMIHSPKRYLLAGSPEVRDQDLAGIVVPGRERERDVTEEQIPTGVGRWLSIRNSHQDKNQVVGKGRDGDQHQWNGLDHIPAKLQHGG